MNKASRRFGRLPGVSCLLIVVAVGWVYSATEKKALSPSAKEQTSPFDVLNSQQRKQVDDCVAKALLWMASKQNPDGSFPSLDSCQPAVTSLAVMAYLSRGHLPGEGPYGETIDRGIRFVMSCQKRDGLLCYEQPTSRPAGTWSLSAAHAGAYSHAIAGMLLCEAYGMTDKEDPNKMRKVIEEAVEFTRMRQIAHKRRKSDKGGWRYLYPRDPADSDLSVASWHIMFLRSARNAGFDVPSQFIDEAMDYVKRCFDPRRGTFDYYPGRGNATRAMAGAGILALSLGGLHKTEMARRAGNWVLQNPGGSPHTDDQYYYATFYCSQAMLQLGGEYWKNYFPRTARHLVTTQHRLGYWPGGQGSNTRLGDVYPTALAVLALTVPYQVLPIFQR